LRHTVEHQTQRIILHCIGADFLGALGVNVPVPRGKLYWVRHTPCVLAHEHPEEVTIKLNFNGILGLTLLHTTYSLGECYGFSINKYLLSSDRM